MRWSVVLIVSYFLFLLPQPVLNRTSMVTDILCCLLMIFVKKHPIFRTKIGSWNPQCIRAAEQTIARHTSQRDIMINTLF